jgi:DNA-binding transcriptional LysR family regulator
LGLSVLSRHTLSLELSANMIAILDVKNFPLMRHWYAVHLTEKKLSLVARTFLDFLTTETKEIVQKIDVHQ